MLAPGTLPNSRLLRAASLILCTARAAYAQEPPPLATPPGSVEERLRELEREMTALRASRVPAPAGVDDKASSGAPAAAAVNYDYQPRVIPFANGDFSWAPGGYAAPDSPLAWGPFHGEIRTDVAYHYSLANPVDDTISGSSEVFRHNELQLTQLGLGGDFYYKGAHARLMTQFGMYSQTTPRNDASPARGQWQLDNAYRYISEAYGGYHINRLGGINIQAGIFMSYVGLWSYYNFDNWTYQPSYVSSNTPWLFNGLRVQVFTSQTLKIEPWLVNGWQAYGKFNEAPGVGLQIRWNPREWISVLGNQYYGADALGIPGRQRIHTDESVMIRYYHHPGSRGLSKAAASLTIDAGCELGDEAHKVSCSTQYFLGFMAYTRFWFFRDLFGLTVGGGAITNPGRYLVLLPPINGATAYSGTPYFTENPGDPFNAWDAQATFDFMPNRYVTFRIELTHRAADQPYFAGHTGVTPPNGSGSYVNVGAPGSMVEGWQPILEYTEDRLTAALLVRL